MALLRFNLKELAMSFEFIESFLKMQMELQLFNISQTLEMFLQEVLCKLLSGFIPKKMESIALPTS